MLLKKIVLFLFFVSFIPLLAYPQTKKNNLLEKRLKNYREKILSKKKSLKKKKVKKGKNVISSELEKRLKSLEEKVILLQNVKTKFHFFMGAGYGASTYSLVNRSNGAKANVGTNPYISINMDQSYEFSENARIFISGHYRKVTTPGSNNKVVPATNFTIASVHNGAEWVSENKWITRTSIGFEQKVFFIPLVSGETSLHAVQVNLPEFTLGFGKEVDFSSMVDSTYISGFASLAVIAGEKRKELTINDGYHGFLRLELGDLSRTWDIFFEAFIENQDTSLTTQTLKDAQAGINISF